MDLKNLTLWLAIIVALFYLLIIGRDLIVPLVIAIAVWYLLNTLTATYQRLEIGHWQPPYAVSLIAAILTFTVLIFLLVDLITRNAASVMAVAPIYQKNLERIMAHTFQFLGLEEPLTIAQLMKEINFGQLITGLAVALATIAGNTLLIFVYVVFLFLEQKSFDRKLATLLADPKREASVHNIINRINRDIQIYIRVKTFISLLTAVISYLIMTMVDIHLASFWALIIFFFNFIPTIGSILATVFPSLLALVQFDTIYPFLIVLLMLGAIQFIIGNFLDPRLMGKSLNLSPLVILLSLALWGSMWGIVGMFLCMPITVIAMIIFSHFPQTHPIAIILSGDGQVKQILSAPEAETS